MAQAELRFQLESILAGGADACERCVGVLTSVAQGHPAVTEARVEAKKEGSGAHLLIRFDGERSPPGQLRAFIEDSGAVIAERFGHFVFRIGGAIHPRTARRIRDHLRAQIGVIQADVRPVGRAFVEFDREKTSEAALLESVRTLGVELRSFDAEALPSKAAAGTVEPPPLLDGHHTGPDDHDHQEEEHRHAHGQGGDHEHAHGHGGGFGERTELIFALLAGAVLAAGWLIERRVAGLVPLAFYVAAYVFGGFFTVREAFENLRQKRFEIEDRCVDLSATQQPMARDLRAIIALLQITVALERMGDYVHEMHRRSGLLDEIRASELTLAEAEEQTLSCIDSHLPQDYRPPMCGNSIGTDRRFLEVQMPKLENRCHYRVVDVSSIKELAWRWYPEAMKQASPKLEAHRALGDILESIAELKFYRTQFMQPPESA